jgi:hypothetical protein
MAATWTLEAREIFLKECGLDGNFVIVRPLLFEPRPVTKPQSTQGRMYREMHVFDAPKRVTPGRVELSEWQSRANYLCLAAYVTEAERRIANDISKRSFLTSEARNALEEIWALCMRRERESHVARG